MEMTIDGETEHNTTEKKLNNMLKGLWKAGEINKIGYDRLRTTWSATPQLYDLPKIHKPEVP